MSTAVARIEPSAGAAIAPVQMLRPIARPSEVLAVQEETRELVTQALAKDRDYGVIPGTGTKPTLLKPGAERVALAFGCYYGEPEILEKEVDHDREVKWSKRKKKWRNAHRGDREFTWDEETGVAHGLYRYVVKVPVINRATGEVIGAGVGACSTMESKYIDRPRDAENTVLKMAFKRAIVAACLTTFGLSDQFTQDVEDLAANAGAAAETPVAEPEPEITRETPITWGKLAGTPIKDLADPYLKWAVQPDRKFGADTARWQAAMQAEIEYRAKEAELEAANKAKEEPATEAVPAAAPAATARPAALADERDDLPF